MKFIIRILAISAGLGALILTGQMVYSTMWGRWEFGHIWSFLWHWPGKLLFALFNFGEVIKSPPLELAVSVLPIIAPLLALLLAKLLDRPRLDWFVLTLIFPVMLTVLALMKPGRASVNPYGGALGHFFAAWRGKYCGKCQKAVPLSSHAGQRCPFCGAYWSYERTVQSR